MYDLALLSGGGDKIKKAVSSHGARDPLATPIINAIVNLGKELRKKAEESELTEEEIEAILVKELANRRKDNLNPLLGMPGARRVGSDGVPC